MKKGLKFTAAALSLSLLLSAGLAGCGKENNNAATPSNQPSSSAQTSSEPEKKVDPVEIKFSYWANASEQKNFEFIAEGIDKVYPEVKVKLQQYPTSDEFWNAIPAAIAANTAPDVIAFSDEGNFEYIVKGTLAPLDDLIQKVGFDKSKIAPSLFKGWTYENKLYGMPYDASTSMLSINKKMFEAAGLKEYPKTMDELVAAAKAMTKDGVYGICANIHEFHITQYAHAFGGGWGFGKSINSPENVQGVQFFVDLYKEHKVAVYPKQLAAAWDGEVFAKGKAAMSTGGPWYFGYVKEASPDMEFVAMPIPKGTVESQSAYSHGLSILSQSKNQEAAMKFISYALRDEAQLKGIEAVGYAPAVSNLMPKYIETNEQLKPIYDNIAKAGMPFAYPEETKNFSAELVKGIEEIIFKDDTTLTVQKLLDDLQAKFGTK